jgi:hypothetical protein
MLSLGRRKQLAEPTFVDPGRPIDLDEPRTKTRPPREYAHGNDDRLDQAMQNVEDELRAYAPKIVREPMPDYVAPRDNVPPVGALSAEALVKDYEKTAKDIEALATQLTENAHQAMTELANLTSHFATVAIEVENVVSHVRQTAEYYRREAKSVFQQIEDTAIRMKEVRDLSAAMRDRLVPSVTDPRLPNIPFTPQEGTDDDADNSNRVGIDRVDSQ